MHRKNYAVIILSNTSVLDFVRVYRLYTLIHSLCEFQAINGVETPILGNQKRLHPRKIFPTNWDVL